MIKRSFPKNFFWGTATAAHQVEGGNNNNDFREWEKLRVNTPDSGKACDQYKRYKEDFKLIKNLNNNVHRISLEWSRIEPKEGKFSAKEIAHYRNVITELKKLGIEPFLTLHHFTNPKWFANKEGWEKSENVFYFERFARECIYNFGDLVTNWIIINEPNVYATLAYIRGFFPPHKKNLFTAFKVYLNLAKTHRNVYKMLKEAFPNSKATSAIAMIKFKTASLLETPILPFAKYLSNYSFLSLTKGCHDFIGINHYFLFLLDWKDIEYIKKVKTKNNSKFFEHQITDFGWIIYPQGIYDVTMETWKKYGLPIIITENGIADAKDELRPAYIKNYLSWLKQAIADGAKVLGYFHWSLLDNIEWGQGEKIRFGLYETDFKTQKRIARKSARIYSDIAKSNGANL